MSNTKKLYITFALIGVIMVISSWAANVAYAHNRVGYTTYQGWQNKRATNCVKHFIALGYDVSTCTETDDGYDLISVDAVGQDITIMVSDYDDEFSYTVFNL